MAKHRARRTAPPPPPPPPPPPTAAEILQAETAARLARAEQVRTRALATMIPIPETAAMANRAGAAARDAVAVLERIDERAPGLDLEFMTDVPAPVTLPPISDDEIARLVEGWQSRMATPTTRPQGAPKTGPRPAKTAKTTGPTPAQAAMISVAARPEGATAAELCAATGRPTAPWKLDVSACQRHGFTFRTGTRDGKTIYHLDQLAS